MLRVTVTELCIQASVVVVLSSNVTELRFAFISYNAISCPLHFRSVAAIYVEMHPICVRRIHTDLAKRACEDLKI